MNTHLPRQVRLNLMYSPGEQKMQGLSSNSSSNLSSNLFSNSSSLHISSNQRMVDRPASIKTHENESEKFLDYVSQGLSFGIQSYPILKPHASSRLYISFIYQLVDPLHLFIRESKKGALIVDLEKQGTITFFESGRNVRMEMNGVKKILLHKSIFNIQRQIYANITKHPKYYGDDLVAYVANLDQFGDAFDIYNKALSPAGFNKNSPYLSMGENRLIKNFNCRIPFYAHNENIVCADFSCRVALSMLEHKTGKFNWDDFRSRESIRKYIPKCIEDSYDHLKNNARRYDLIKNDELGIYLSNRFREMASSQKTRVGSVVIFLIESVDHSMLIRLRYKYLRGKWTYVVSLYDPNKTNTAVRYETENLSVIRTMPLETYINGLANSKKNPYRRYYPAGEEMSLILECDISTLSSPPKKCPVKRLSSQPFTEITPSLVFHLVAENFFHEFNAIKDKLHQIGKESPQRLIDLLSIKVREDEPLLNFALKLGFSEIVETYVELIKPIAHHKQCNELIAARRNDGKPGIYSAIKYSQIETIKVYYELLKLIPDKRFCDNLINSLYQDYEIADIYLVCCAGFTNSVTIFARLMKLVTDEKIRTSLITSKLINKTLNLSLSMELGSVESINAWGELLPFMPDERYRVEFLAAKNFKGVPGLHSAIQLGFGRAITSFGKLLLHVTDMDNRVQLISAKNEDGLSGLSAALINNGVDVINPYYELFDLVPSDAHSRLTKDSIEILMNAVS